MTVLIIVAFAILFILLSGLKFATIAFFSECEIEIVAVEANPIAFSRHGVHDCMSVYFLWRSGIGAKVLIFHSNKINNRQIRI